MEVEIQWKTLEDRFATLADPRVVGRTLHGLLDILFLSLCAMICGMEDWEAIEDWGNERLIVLMNRRQRGIVAKDLAYAMLRPHLKNALVNETKLGAGRVSFPSYFNAGNRVVQLDRTDGIVGQISQ